MVVETIGVKKITTTLCVCSSRGGCGACYVGGCNWVDGRRVVYAKLARSLYCLSVDHVNFLKKRFATRDMITMVM
jgi:hypothetical protein